VKFKKDLFLNYLKEAPTALAIERLLECNILMKQEFNRPILDLGCGEGLFSYIFFDEKIDVGIDPNGHEIERARSYNMYDELIVCYGDKIPKESGSFNTIFSNSVLEHIPDIESVLREAHRLLAPGGKFYVTIPTDYFDRYSVMYQSLLSIGLNGMAENYRKFFNKFWKLYHYYDENGWRALFQKAGFTILKVQKYGMRETCILNDRLTPLAMVSFVEKKLFNKWFVLKPVRDLYVPLLNQMFSPAIKADRETPDSGLIFFCLTKI
jgi:SAM-dependent methyltransferase